MAVSLSFLPRDLRKALMPFQKDGIRYGLEKDGRCLIGDEMGLGKTLQALSVAYYFKNDWPLLVIVPSSMKYPWVDEIEKWLPEIPPEEINLIKSCSDLTALAKAKINILSYGLISLRSGLNSVLIEAVKKANIGVAIVDESHYVKNRQASRTQRITLLLKQMKRVILLTGTPSLARPEELFVQINIVKPGLVGNWHYFAERFCDGRYVLQTMRGGKVFRKFDTRGASNLKELHGILTKSFMIRRLKRDVLTELPAKRRQRIRFDISADSERKKNLEESLKSFKTVVSRLKTQLNVIDDANLLSMSDVNMAITNLYKHTGLAKAGAIQEYISELLDAMENKFVVFCYHLAVIDAVTEILARRGTRYIRIAGDVPSEVRANYVREFQSQPKCRVAVLSITAASMGITLTAADHVVFAELHWTPGVIKQAEDRCHRIGQKSAVQIHFLTAKGTIDDVLWSMLSRKLTVTSETLDGEAQLLTADEGDRGKSNLLSLCQAWFPDDEEDDEADLFTPKAKAKDESQRDIRACFVKSAEVKKRKTRTYYENGLADMSVNEDNQEFKPQHKRSKRRKESKQDEAKQLSNRNAYDIVVLDDSCDESNVQDHSGQLERTDEVAIEKSTVSHPSYPQLASKAEENLSKNNIYEQFVGKRTFEETAEGSCSVSRDAEALRHSPSKENAESSNYETGMTNLEECLADEQLESGSKDGNYDMFDCNEAVVEEAESIVQNSWQCLLCTFCNHADLNVCEMCEARRPESHVQTRSRGVTLVSRDGECQSYKRSPLRISKRTRNSNENNEEGVHDLSTSSESMNISLSPPPKPRSCTEHDVKNSCSVAIPTPSEHVSCDETHESLVGQPNECLKIVDETSAITKLEAGLTNGEMSSVKKGGMPAGPSSLPVVVNMVNRRDKYMPSCKASTNESTTSITYNHAASDSEVQTATDSSSGSDNDWFDVGDGGSCSKRSDLRPKQGKRNRKRTHADDQCSTISLADHYSKVSENPIKETGSFVLRDEDSAASLGKYDSSTLNSPLVFSSPEDDSEDPECRPQSSTARFRLASALLKEEQAGSDRKLKVESATEKDADSNIGNVSSLSDPDSDATVDLSTCAGELHETAPVNTEIDPESHPHANEDCKADDACEDDAAFLLDGDFDDEISLVPSEHSESEAESEEEVQPVDLLFKMSFESDRVYLYNLNEEPLGINLHIPDLGFLNNDDLPRIFSHADNLKQLRKLSREWSLLTTTKQRLIRKSGLVFRSPLDAYCKLKEMRYGNPSNERFSSKEKRNENVKTIAACIGGSVAEIKDSKHQRYGSKAPGKSSKAVEAGCESSESEPQMLLQAVDTEGDPLCLFCKNKVKTGFKAGSRQAMFCSYNCQEEYLFRTSKSRIVRERLFGLERGVCQICQFDVHQLYTQIAALRKKDRKAALGATHFAKLPVATLNKIISNPKQGQFWEADHINAVSEGGGECGLENYRTLCIPCHRNVTKDLHKRLRHKRMIDKRKAEGITDIGAFFGRTDPSSDSHKDTNAQNSNDFSVPFASISGQILRGPLTNPANVFHKDEPEPSRTVTKSEMTSLKKKRSTGKVVDGREGNFTNTKSRENDSSVGCAVDRALNVEQRENSFDDALLHSKAAAKNVLSTRGRKSVNSKADAFMEEGDTQKIAANVACSTKTFQKCLVSASEGSANKASVSCEQVSQAENYGVGSKMGSALQHVPTAAARTVSSQPLSKNRKVTKRSVNVERKPSMDSSTGSSAFKKGKGEKMSKSLVKITEEEIKKSDEKISALIAKSTKNRNRSKR